MDKKQTMTNGAVRASIEAKLTSYFGVSPEEATEEQIFKATALSVKELLTAKRQVFHDKIKRAHPRRVYYLCMEFLVGRQMRNNLMNLGIEEVHALEKAMATYSSVLAWRIPGTGKPGVLPSMGSNRVGHD